MGRAGSRCPAEGHKHARTLDQQLDRLLTHSRSDTDDDTCIVGIRITGAGRGRPPGTDVREVAARG